MTYKLDQWSWNHFWNKGLAQLINHGPSGAAVAIQASLVTCPVIFHSPPTDQWNVQFARTSSNNVQHVLSASHSLNQKLISRFNHPWWLWGRSFPPLYSPIFLSQKTSKNFEMWYRIRIQYEFNIIRLQSGTQAVIGSFVVVSSMCGLFFHCFSVNYFWYCCFQERICVSAWLIKITKMQTIYRKLDVSRSSVSFIPNLFNFFGISCMSYRDFELRTSILFSIE